MPLYFRSDTRPLDIIQKTGFSAREDYNDEWWRVAARANTPLRYMERKKADDAVKCACVSLSTKFESSVLFPISYQPDTVYVYAIALPPASQIHYNDKGELILKDQQGSPAEAERKVIDLHSLQATQVGNIFNAEKNDKVNRYCQEGLYAYSAWPLYAYEAIAYSIPKENIISVLKIERAYEHNIRIGNPWTFDDTHFPKRKFKIKDDLILNNYFEPTQTYLSSSTGNSTLIHIDYRAEAEQAYQVMNRLMNEKNLKTPNVYYGLGGKTF